MDQLEYGLKKLTSLLNMSSYVLNKHYLEDMLGSGIVFYMWNSNHRGRDNQIAFFPSVVMMYFGALGMEDYKRMKAVGKEPVGLGKRPEGEKELVTKKWEENRKNILENDVFWTNIMPEIL